MRPMVAVRTKQNEIVVVKTSLLHALQQRVGWFIGDSLHRVDMVYCLGWRDVTVWQNAFLDSLTSASLT